MLRRTGAIRCVRAASRAISAIASSIRSARPRLWKRRRISAASAYRVVAGWPASAAALSDPEHFDHRPFALLDLAEVLRLGGNPSEAAVPATSPTETRLDKGGR